MSKEPFHNEASQEDRYAVLMTDKQQKNTMLAHTRPGDEMQGRYAAEGKHTIIGAQSQIQYPKAADWSCTQLPDEPPLGWSVEDQEPVGTFQEIEASLGNDRSSSSSPPIAAESEDDAPLPSPRSTSSSAGALPVGGVGGENSDSLVSLRRSPPNNFKRRI